jgi:large subunit ribosomal protein L1
VEPLSLGQAVKKLKSFASTKFDQSVDIAIFMGIDTKQADQAIRGAISLPHGIGKARRVIAFCEDADAAKAAGAIEAGVEDLIKKINDGWFDFDVAVASPKIMGKVGKLGKVLGPQGKMPSPKNGTVTADVVTAVKEFAAGKVEFRNDTGGNVHAVVGKLSFDENKLAENIGAFIDHIKRMKPSSVKGTYIKKISLAATMSPGVQLDLSGI